MGLKIDEARAVLAALEDKLTDATNRGTDLQTERRKISFDAHSGDAKARTRLDKLNAGSMTSELLLQSLMAAVDEAKARVASAEHYEAQAEARERATEALALAGTAAKRGPRIRDLARDLCDELKAAIADVQRLNHLGAPITNQRILELALTRTILPMLREAGLDVELIAPGQRHDPEELVSGYVNRVTDWAGRVLGATKEAA